jgi:hypothetical protein
MAEATWVFHVSVYRYPSFPWNSLASAEWIQRTTSYDLCRSLTSKYYVVRKSRYDTPLCVSSKEPNVAVPTQTFIASLSIQSWCVVFACENCKCGMTKFISFSQQRLHSFTFSVATTFIHFLSSDYIHSLSQQRRLDIFDAFQDPITSSAYRTCEETR